MTGHFRHLTVLGNCSLRRVHRHGVTALCILNCEKIHNYDKKENKDAVPDGVRVYSVFVRDSSTGSGTDGVCAAKQPAARSDPALWSSSATYIARWSAHSV